MRSLLATQLVTLCVVLCFTVTNARQELKPENEDGTYRLHVKML